MSTAVKKSISIQVEGLPEVRAELVRFYAPVTVDELIRRLPIEGFLATWEDAVYITTGIERGAEKTVARLKAGDIFYWPPGRILGVALAEQQARSQTVKVGRAVDDVSPLREARSGSRMRFVPLP